MLIIRWEICCYIASQEIVDITLYKAILATGALKATRMVIQGSLARQAGQGVGMLTGILTGGVASMRDLEC